MQGFFNEVALDLVTADGKKLAVLANALERRDDEGNLLFTRLTIFQATERRRYERDLVEARREAEQGLEAERDASELREQFIAVLGHDLRNPLAGIDAGLRMLQRHGFDEGRQPYSEQMRRSVGRMHELIDNVLDLTRSRLGGGIPLRIRAGSACRTGAWRRSLRSCGSSTRSASLRSPWNCRTCRLRPRPHRPTSVEPAWERA